MSLTNADMTKFRKMCEEHRPTHKISWSDIHAIELKIFDNHYRKGKALFEIYKCQNISTNTYILAIVAGKSHAEAKKEACNSVGLPYFD